MNILIYSSNSIYINMGGGAEVALKLIAEKFAKLGENVVYLTSSNKKIPEYKTKVINGVKVVCFNPIKWPGYNGKLKQSLCRYQVKKVMKHIIKKYNIDIVHTYNEYPNTYDILQVKEKYNLNFRVIIRIAGLYWKKQIESNSQFKNYIEYVYKNVDMINFLSDDFKDMAFKEMTNLGIQNICNNTCIMDIGYNNYIFNSVWKQRENRNFKIVMISKFSDYQKRQDLLVDAIHYMKQKGYTDVEVCFIGAGEEQNKIEKKVKDFQLNNFSFFGRISQDKIQNILLKSDLNVLITEFEGVPKSMLEAMSVGIPVLVSDVKPLNSYIIDGNNGFLVRNDKKDIAEKIISIINNKEDMNRISKNGKKYVNNNFNPDNNIMMYKTVFEGLVK